MSYLASWLQPGAAGSMDKTSFDELGTEARLVRFVRWKSMADGRVATAESVAGRSGHQRRQLLLEVWHSWCLGPVAFETG